MLTKEDPEANIKESYSIEELRRMKDRLQQIENALKKDY
jgi:hypothetical protein